MIPYLFTGWIASIATFLMEAFERIDMGRFAFRAIAFIGVFIGIRCAAFRSSSAAVRPAAEQCRADRHDKVESSQSRVDTGFSLPKAAIKALSICEARLSNAASEDYGDNLKTSCT